MKAEVKAQWVKDLRSGQYEQGKSYLERVNADGTHKLCCLGVLCRQAVAAGAIPAAELHDNSYRYLDDEQDGYGKVTGESFSQSSSLPRKVAEWAGLPFAGDIAGDVELVPAHETGANADLAGLSAIEANDMYEMSFTEIADLIEQNVPAE